MVVINYSITYKALDGFVDDHNERSQEVKDKVKASVLLTAKEIIRIYGAFLIKANGIMNITEESVPALKTNNSQLASLVKVSPRTIQRHIIKLQKAGIITGKKFCGSNSGYELWINPEILLVRSKKTKDEAAKELNEKLQKTENRPIVKGGTTKCPDTYTGNNSYNKNNLLIAVDNPKVRPSDQGKTGNKRNRCSLPLTAVLKQTGYNTGNILTGNTGEKVIKGPSCHSGSNEETGEKVHLRDENWKQQSARSTSLSFYAESLWNLARNLLYKNVFLTEFQQKQAKQMLEGWYQPVSEKHLASVHQNYCERIHLARDFVAKDPERRFVQLPYRYFDTSNPSGFTGTKKWYQKHLARKEEVRKKLILHAQIKKYLNNEKKDKRRPPLEVYRECETRVGKLKDSALMELFYAAILKPEVINQINYV